MKKRYLIIIIILLLIFVPMFISKAKADHTGYVNDLVNFVKGKGAIEDWFMNVFRTKVEKDMSDLAFRASLLGRAIGGVGALISLSYMGWQMQAGDREWEVMPMFRPLFIGLILMNWVSFYQLIEAPFKYLADPAIAKFNTINKEANDLRATRFAKQQALVKFLIADKSKRAVEKAKKDDSWVPYSEELAKLSVTIEEWELSMKFSAQKFASAIIEAIGLAILRIATYFIFFIQMIWKYILVVLGPIAVGLALMPGFTSSLTSWISKFINISLYSFISFNIINIGQILIMSGYSIEIDRLNHFMNSHNVIPESKLPLISNYLENSGMIYSVLFTFVAYGITAMAILMTPTIADSIVSAGGANVMSKMKSAGQKLASGTRTAGRLGGGLGGNLAGRGGSVLKQMGKDLKNINKSPTEKLLSK